MFIDKSEGIPIGFYDYYDLTDELRLKMRTCQSKLTVKLLPLLLLTLSNLAVSSNIKLL